jgi:citrate lyase subunit beta/citryl-CoA lyase
MAEISILRSLLFVPGTRPDRFDKALASGADAVIVDLEDSVEPGRKAEARRLVGEWLSTTSASGGALFVRINAPGSEWIDDDCEWLRPFAGLIEGVVLPKVEHAAAIEGVARGFPEIAVIPLLETARGILNAADIVSADARIPAVLFGAEDLTAEIGIPRTLDGSEILVARSTVVLAAATIGAEAVDAVWTHLSDMVGLETDAGHARALGFRGKMAIHPDQIPVINHVFSPSAEEIEAARRLVEASREPLERGEGAFRIDGRMVDAPIIKRAERILELARILRGG